jgi:hypothetical protein
MSRALCCVFVSLVIGLVCAPLASATTVAESGDAGRLPATAQATTGNSVTRITGAITGNDQDMYALQIGSSANLSFGASTATGSDPRLYLFDSAGRLIIGNDDCQALNAEACFTTPLAPGSYYLAIAGASVPHFNGMGVINNWTGPGGPSFNYAITLTTGPLPRRNHVPRATAQTVTTTVNSPVSFTLGGTDSDSDPLTFIISTPPTHGTVLCAGAVCQYKPDIGFVGKDTLIYSVYDPFLAFDSAKITIKVKA